MNASDGSPPTPWFMYVIECIDGSLYTGIARDVHKRFEQHRQGKGARYTRSHPPRHLLAYLGFDSRGDALAAEYTFKQLTRTQKIAHLKRWNNIDEDTH